MLRSYIILGAVTAMLHAQNHPKAPFRPEIPRMWDDAAMADLELPLPRPAYSLRMISAETYYRIPMRPVYRSYPVYARDREPDGYLDGLRRRDPKIAFDAARLKSEQDWQRAGELVFDAPIAMEEGIKQAVGRTCALQIDGEMFR